MSRHNVSPWNQSSLRRIRKSGRCTLLNSNPNSCLPSQHESPTLSTRIASCSCGQLTATAVEDPIRVRSATVSHASAEREVCLALKPVSAGRACRSKADLRSTFVSGMKEARSRSTSAPLVVQRCTTRSEKTASPFRWVRLPIPTSPGQASRSTKNACTPGSACRRTLSTWRNGCAEAWP